MFSCFAFLLAWIPFYSPSSPSYFCKIAIVCHIGPLPHPYSRQGCTSPGSHGYLPWMCVCVHSASFGLHLIGADSNKSLIPKEMCNTTFLYNCTIWAATVAQWLRCSSTVLKHVGSILPATASAFQSGQNARTPCTVRCSCTLRNPKFPKWSGALLCDIPHSLNHFLFFFSGFSLVFSTCTNSE